MKIGVNICYIELIFILMSVFKQQKLMKKNIVRDIIFVEKKLDALEALIVNLLELRQVMQKMVMVQIMRLVMYKHLLMSSKIKKKIKKTRKKINKRKRNERKTRKINERKIRKRNDRNEREIRK